MANQYLGEIRMFGGNFAPQGWALCEGQILSISQNTALFSLLGTTYGGNGTATFALPDLRGRVAINWGQGPGLSQYVIGQIAGSETVTLLANQLPAHSHPVNCSSGGGTQASPADGFPAVESTGTSQDFATTSNATMNSAMIAGNTGGQAHSNIQPYLSVTFIIALQGIFPSRN